MGTGEVGREERTRAEGAERGTRDSRSEGKGQAGESAGSVRSVNFLTLRCYAAPSSLLGPPPPPGFRSPAVLSQPAFRPLASPPLPPSRPQRS